MKSNNNKFIVSFFCFISLVVALIPAQVLAENVIKDEKIIRKIHIEIKPIFEDAKSNWFYNTANDLKIDTKDFVVKRELFLKEGDYFNEFALNESRRNLRSIRYLSNAQIYVIDVDDKYVDLKVVVNETWTLFPQFSFSLLADAKKTSAGLSERNILGYGKRLELLYSDDEGREKYEGVFDDPRLWGTNKRLLFGHFERTDGFRTLLNIGRPFRTLVDPSSWGVDTYNSDLVERLFDAGDERFIYRKKQQSLNARYALSIGDPGVLRRRIAFGYEFINEEFKQATERDFNQANVDPLTVDNNPALVPDDRRFSGPFFSYEEIVPNYISRNYIDQFERFQDFNLGLEWRLKASYAPEALGSEGNNAIVLFNVRKGADLGNDDFLRGRFGVSSRVNSDGLENTIGSLESKYFRRLGQQYLSDLDFGYHTLASDLVLEVGDNLDRDVEFVLGAQNGLRGYSARALTGDYLFRFNLEDRAHLAEDVFKIFSFGTTLFLDAGGASRGSFADVFKDRFYTNIGFGLRFGFPKTAGGAVFRADIALPLRDGIDGTDKFSPQLVVSLEQAFGARLRDESSTGVTEDLSVGLTQ